MIETVLSIGVLLIGFALLQGISNRLKFPYTILLLIFGFIAQELFILVNLPHHISLESEFTYSVLLPFLLFGAAIHINFHQFRLQFKTISFLATFGLLLSILIIGGFLMFALGWNLTTGLLFGALISATDPIAVLSLFKSLGGPKRLALLADGESMFNDATAVVLFRILLALTVGGTTFSQLTILESAGLFLYTFFGSIILGAVCGYLVSQALIKIENNLQIETTIMIGFSLLIFAGSEHYLNLSGVIAAVIAGLFVGNLSGLRTSSRISHFVHEFWDYLGFIAVSFVFFFATFDLDLSFFVHKFPEWVWVVIAVLIARAISVYISVFITNNMSFFKDEPNIPKTWQHILNWGGLRGVIPLVLVLSLPETYPMKTVMFDFTFAILLFTLLVNGSTIGKLLIKLKLHLPSNYEKIKNLNNTLFNYEDAIETLGEGDFLGISKETVQKQIANWRKREQGILNTISKISPQDYHNALSMQSLHIERKMYEQLLHSDEMSEAAFYEMDAQLDLQADAIEYPELNIRGVDVKGKIKSSKLFRQQILRLRYSLIKFPNFSKFFGVTKEKLFLDRFMIIRARLIGTNRVLRYFKELRTSKIHSQFIPVLNRLSKKYETYQKRAQIDLKKINKKMSFKSHEEMLIHRNLSQNHSVWTM